MTMTTSTRDALLLLDAGLAEEALEAAEAAVASAPEDVVALQTLSVVHFRARRYASATVAAREAVGKDPGVAESHRLLAQAAILTKAPDSYALDAAREAVRLAPEEASTHATLGAVLQMANRRRAAVSALGDASRLDPDDATGARSLRRQIVTSSLLVRLQLVAWGLVLSVLALMGVVGSTGRPQPVALVVVLLLAVVLVVVIVWRYAVLIRGGGTFWAVMRSDGLLATCAVATGLALVLPFVSLFLAGASALAALSTAVLALVVALILIAVRRVLK